MLHICLVHFVVCVSVFLGQQTNATWDSLHATAPTCCCLPWTLCSWLLWLWSLVGIGWRRRKPGIDSCSGPACSETSCNGDGCWRQPGDLRWRVPKCECSTAAHVLLGLGQTWINHWLELFHCGSFTFSFCTYLPIMFWFSSCAALCADECVAAQLCSHMKCW